MFFFSPITQIFLFSECLQATLRPGPSSQSLQESFSNSNRHPSTVFDVSRHHSYYDGALQTHATHPLCVSGDTDLHPWRVLVFTM